MTGVADWFYQVASNIGLDLYHHFIYKTILVSLALIYSQYFTIFKCSVKFGSLTSFNLYIFCTVNSYICFLILISLIIVLHCAV